MAKTARSAMVVAIGVSLTMLPFFPAQGATPKTKRVSVRSNGAEVEGGNSLAPSISATGRFVSFESDATNVVGGDDNASSDVFVHDRKTKKTRRVSVRSNGDEADGDSRNPSISADGRFVSFESFATNLVPGDDIGKNDVFVHDRKTGKTRRVSVRSNGVQGDFGSFKPSISANGRFVSFESVATNLVADDDNGSSDVFVHDRNTSKTKRVSVRSNGDEAEGGLSNYPSISATGRFVAFRSLATNLVPGDDNGQNDVFVHDRKTGKTRRVSVRSNGDQGDFGSLNPSISANGRFVSFESVAPNLVADDDNGTADVFVHDRNTSKTKRVSVRSNGNEADGGSRYPSISATGRFVSFESFATNLVDSDANGQYDAFMHDRKTGKTRRVSVRSNGDEAEGASEASSVSADGRFVAFNSHADNLVPDDDNNNHDVYVRGPLR